MLSLASFVSSMTINEKNRDKKQELNPPHEAEHLAEQEAVTDDKVIETPLTEHCVSTGRYPRLINVLVYVARIVIGAVFIFSGVVKLIDPHGTAFKIEDYLAFMGLSSWDSISFAAAMTLSVIELILGVNTILGSYLRTTPWLVLGFMLIMTPLTLFLAIANPIPDCGCFGDAVKLTNWHTFGKNLILLLLTFVLVRYNRRVRSIFHREIQALVVTWCIIYAAIISGFAIYRMPLLDFRPFKVGVDLRSAYHGDDVADVEYDFVYERDGVKQNFTIDNLPSAQDGWTFVSRTARTAPPAVSHDEALDYFIVYDGDTDVTEEILDADGYTFMLLSPDVTKANDKYINKVLELYDYCQEYGYPFYAVTSSSPAQIAAWMDNTGGEFHFLFMDKTTIRTIARPNPFVLVLKDGVILHKYPISQLPDEHLLVESYDMIDIYGTAATYNVQKRSAFIALTLVVPLVLLLLTERVALFLLRSFRNRRKNKKNAKIQN